MSPQFKFLERIVLAALPVLAAASSVYDSVFLATLITVNFLILGFFYRRAWSFFPRGVLGFSVILFLIFTGCAAWYFLDITPIWIASVLLLGVTDFKLKRKKTKPPSRVRGGAEIISNSSTAILGRGFSFWYVFVGAALLRYGFTKYFPLAALEQPGGSFLLLAGAAFVIQWRLGTGKTLAKAD